LHHMSRIRYPSERNRRGPLTAGFTMLGAGRISKLAVTSSRSPLLARWSGVETPRMHGLVTARDTVVGKTNLYHDAGVLVHELADAVSFLCIAFLFVPLSPG